VAVRGKRVMLAEQDEERHDPQPGRDYDRREFVGLQRRWVGTAWGGHVVQATAVQGKPANP
jgi:hypothetical protein